MSEVFFKELEIPASQYNLGTGSASHAVQTGSMLIKVEEVLQKERPDLVCVYGDTNSTLAGALASAKLNIPVIHVEAGLRSYNRKMPEEINRIIADRCSNILLCPTMGAVENLQKEGFKRIVNNGKILEDDNTDLELRFADESLVVNVGDIMMDAFLFASERAPETESETPFIFATVHRQENTDDKDRLFSILRLLDESDDLVILSLHPRTEKRINQSGFKPSGSLRFISPLSYFETMGYLRKCLFVMTDSGGLQKEAYFAGKKCITLRDETEWTELVDKGANRVTGTNKNRIIDAVTWAKRQENFPEGIYGHGNTSRLILKVIKKIFS